MKLLLFFHATWCNPCKFVEKNVIAKLKEKYGDKIVCVNVQDEPFYAESLKNVNIPTILVFDDAKEIYRKQGVYHNLEDLENLLND